MGLDTIGGNDKARKIAQALGFSSAEELKAEYVDDSAVSRYDIKYDTYTKELVLVNKTTGAEEKTGLYMPSTNW